MIRRVEQGGRKHTEARGADNGHGAGEVERASANLAIVAAGDAVVPLQDDEPPHHRHILHPRTQFTLPSVAPAGILFPWKSGLWASPSSPRSKLVGGRDSGGGYFLALAQFRQYLT
jgi:hypothetical protein